MCRLQKQDVFLCCKKSFQLFNLQKKSKTACESHQLSENAISKIATDEIHRVIDLVKNDKEYFVEYVNSLSEKEVKKQLRDKENQLKKSETRLKEVEKLFKNTYEDKAFGNISAEDFKFLSNDYSKEKSALATKILTLESKIQSIKEKSNGTARFLGLVNQYTDFKELTSEILNTFIERIEIHRSKHIDGKTFQQVDIYFTHIGKIF